MTQIDCLSWNASHGSPWNEDPGPLIVRPQHPHRHTKIKYGTITAREQLLGSNENYLKKEIIKTH